MESNKVTLNKRVYLPCPFCGSHKIFVGSSGKGFEARCTDCGCSTTNIDWTQTFYDDERKFHTNRTFDEQTDRGEELVLRLWNKRTTIKS